MVRAVGQRGARVDRTAARRNFYQDIFRSEAYPSGHAALMVMLKVRAKELFLLQPLLHATYRQSQ